MKRFSLKFKRLNAVTLADHARDAGQWELATQLYREALDCNPYDPPIWVQYGHALKESGQLRDPDKLAQAGAAYRRALSLDPGAADPHLQLGHVLKLLGKTDDAKASYVRAFALDPSMPYPLEELRGLGWSEAELSELRSVVLADDHDLHSAAPARPSRSSTSTGLLISTRRPAPELHRPTAHNAFSISRVDVHSLLARRAAPESPSIWNASSADAPSIAREEVFSAGTTVSERAVSAAGAQTEVPLSEQMAVVNAVILAQRWDLDGVKEQLQDAVEEKRQLEALLTARISALETELRDVYASGDATSSLPEIDQAMPARVHQVPDTADMGRGYERLSRFLENGAGCEGQNPRRSSEGPVPFYLSEARNLDQNPHPLFDPVYYRAQAATRGLIVSDPLAHFAEVGGVLGLSPHPLFDAAYYLDANPDVKATGDDPLRHYLLHGDREGRNPHRLFSADG